MNVLSLFDGMSCGQIALEKCGIKVENYFASEIDKYASKVTQQNYPNTIQLGDITKWKEWDLPKIDLIIGGSPCQGFSFAGKQLNFDDPRSKLFFTFVDIVNYYNPTYFLLENVKMKKEYQNVISSCMGVEPIEINSALVSAQNRRRLYWTNIQDIKQPKDKYIYLKDILEKDVDDKYIYNKEKTFKFLETASIKSNYIQCDRSGKQYNSQADRIYFEHRKMGCLSANRTASKTNIIKFNKKGGLKKYQTKASCLSGGGHSGGNHSDMDILCVRMVGRNIENGTRKDTKKIKLKQRLEGKKNGKSNCLSTVQKDNLILNIDDIILRRLTPLECERLQTVPENYTNHVSNTQRYKMLGNGWTVDVITHIFKNIIKGG